VAVDSSEIECTDYTVTIETDTPPEEKPTVEDVLAAFHQALCQTEMLLLQHVQELAEARFDPGKLANIRQPKGLG
jgi:hypothetical protein